MPTSAITRTDVPAQPILFIRRSITRSEIGETITDCLKALSDYCRGSDLEPSGPPFARYPEMSADRLTMEIGMPFSSPVAGAGEIEAGFLQSGPAVMAVHEGDYDRLAETYDAIAGWIQANRLSRVGAPWESYVTDPEEIPDPAGWRTEVYWPIAD